MLDERTKMMLEVANVLTAEDLEYLRSQAPATEVGDGSVVAVPIARAVSKKTALTRRVVSADGSRGERERRRTRESKVSTVCVGQERQKHEWWPVGAELVGCISAETFTAQVMENPQVKSGRSLLITSGPAQGRVCITPTRAAIEATEVFRQTHNLGRGGGVTNGWTFWQPTST